MTGRSSPKTVTKFILLIVGVFLVLPFLLYVELEALVDEPAAGGSFPIEVIPLLVLWLTFVGLARRVGYEGWDAVYLFWVPVYGFVFMVKVLWRMANLPDNRYWSNHRTS